MLGLGFSSYERKSSRNKANTGYPMADRHCPRQRVWKTHQDHHLTISGWGSIITVGSTLGISMVYIASTQHLIGQHIDASIETLRIRGLRYQSQIFMREIQLLRHLPNDKSCSSNVYIIWYIRGGGKNIKKGLMQDNYQILQKCLKW